MSKPVLSELEYNADDVASAILSQADLSIANDDLGVLDISSSFSFDSGWQAEAHGIIAYKFMGFVFVNINCVHLNGNPVSGEGIGSVNNSSYRPSAKQTLPSIANEADSNAYVCFQTNGNIDQFNPEPSGSSHFYLCINGWYRI